MLSWAAGALLLLLFFYAATAWLWSAARSSAATALENQVSAVLAADLSEGNLFKLGASLARLMQAGSLDYAEIRSLSDAGGWEKIFRTHSQFGDTDSSFSGFVCGGGRRIVPHRGEGVSLVTTLPANIEGSDCVALLLSSDLPSDLKSFKNKLSMAIGLLLAALAVFFFRLTVAWQRKTTALEVAARTAQAEKEAAIGRLAAQVAHDIRSPLAALGAAACGLDLPAAQRDLVEGAVGRIQGIADDLLKRYRGAGAKSAPAALSLAPLVEQIVAEKRIQHGNKPELKISFVRPAAPVRAAVDPGELQRMVSNLLNNSLEALEGGGTVTLRLSSAEGRARLEVSDDGKGIPADVLATLGTKGRTHDKAGGSGLGLYHARTAAEGWGGSLRIESAPGKGTTVTVDLPAAPGASSRRAALLDDDMLVTMNWKMAAKAAGVELAAHRTPAEFLEALKDAPRDTPLYIDSDLGEGAKGEEVAEALREKGFSDITMATGHGPEKFSHLPWLKVAGKEPPWN